MTDPGALNPDQISHNMSYMVSPILLIPIRRGVVGVECAGARKAEEEREREERRGSEMASSARTAGEAIAGLLENALVLESLHLELTHGLRTWRAAGVREVWGGTGACPAVYSRLGEVQQGQEHWQRVEELQEELARSARKSSSSSSSSSSTNTTISFSIPCSKCSCIWWACATAAAAAAITTTLTRLLVLSLASPSSRLPGSTSAHAEVVRLKSRETELTRQHQDLSTELSRLHTQMSRMLTRSSAACFALRCAGSKQRDEGALECSYLLGHAYDAESSTGWSGRCFWSIRSTRSIRYMRYKFYKVYRL